MQNDILKYILGRAKKSVLLPFYGSIYKLKKLANIKILLSKAFIKISAVIKSLFSMRPKKSTDYFYVGKLGIYKKLLLICVLFICIAPIIYFEFFDKTSPIAVEVPTTAEYIYNDIALKDYSGLARILSGDKVLVYKGDISKGICTGKGELYGTNNLVLYSGEFKENEYSGYGKLYYPSGKLMYEGVFKANKFEGEGILYNADGSLQYKGLFKTGKFEGQGTLYNANGSINYAGGFLNGLKYGEGKLYNETGSNLVYEGSFIDNSFSGSGLLYSGNGTTLYKGTFKNNAYEGEGILYDAKTTRPVYQGQLSNGLFDGIGTLNASTGRSIFTGNFLKGLVDYAYFLDLPSSQLKAHFFSQTSIINNANTNYICYTDMKVSFLVDAINLDAASTKAIAEPTINSILVYDGNKPIGLEKCNSIQDFNTILGDPIYAGYTFALPQDLIALKSLMDNGLISKNNKLHDSISLLGDLETEFLLESKIELYVLCYEYSGYTLSLFLDTKDGNFMYYTIDSL